MVTKFRISGAFFENDKRGGPAFTGFVEIDGKKEMIALWPKTSAKGQNYFQVSEDKKKGDTASTPKTASPFKPKVAGNDPRNVAGREFRDDLDDDIPF